MIIVIIITQQQGLKKQERKWPKMVIMTLNISQGISGTPRILLRYTHVEIIKDACRIVNLSKCLIKASQISDLNIQ